jgi:hypothetical protein
MTQDDLKTLWKFVGGSDGRAFESWLYAHPELEESLGRDLHLELISGRFSDAGEIARLRVRLENELAARFPKPCNCFVWSDRATVNLPWELDFPSVVPFRLDILAEHPKHHWFELVRCRVCGQHWLLGTDSTDDFYHFARVTPQAVEPVLKGGRWPRDLDDLPIFKQYASWWKAKPPQREKDPLPHDRDLANWAKRQSWSELKEHFVAQVDQGAGHLKGVLRVVELLNEKPLSYGRHDNVLLVAADPGFAPDPWILRVCPDEHYTWLTCESSLWGGGYQPGRIDHGLREFFRLHHSLGEKWIEK